jgi:hypothetical protein
VRFHPSAPSTVTPYERIVAEVAREARRRVSAIVRKLQRMTDVTSGDNSPLTNAWDEVCVQVQIEHSFLWFAYEATVHKLVDGELEGLRAIELKALWLQTGPGMDWSCTPEGQDGIAVPNVDDVVPVIMNDVWSLASDWSNARIRSFVGPNSGFQRQGQDIYADAKAPCETNALRVVDDLAEQPAGDDEEDSALVHQWAEEHRRSLEENRPDRFRAMQRVGTLEAHCLNVAREAERTFLDLLLPAEEQFHRIQGYEAKVAHMEAADMEARSRVMREYILVPDLETERAEREGGYR